MRTGKEANLSFNQCERIAKRLFDKDSRNIHREDVSMYNSKAIEIITVIFNTLKELYNIGVRIKLNSSMVKLNSIKKDVKLNDLAIKNIRRDIEAKQEVLKDYQKTRELYEAENKELTKQWKEAYAQYRRAESEATSSVTSEEEFIAAIYSEELLELEKQKMIADVYLFECRDLLVKNQKDINDINVLIEAQNKALNSLTIAEKNLNVKLAEASEKNEFWGILASLSFLNI